MTRDADKQREREFLRRTFEELGISFTITAEPEPPDFVLEIDGASVAVEVTQARNQAAAAGKGVLKRLKEGLRDGLRARGLNYEIFVALTSPEMVELTRKKKLLSAHLATLIGLCESAGSKEAVYERKELTVLGLSHFAKIAITPGSEPEIGWVIRGGKEGPTLIQAAIDSKRSKIEVYRKAAPTVWLLVVGSLGIGGTLDAHDARGPFLSPFDRTLFFEAYEGITVDLRITGTGNTEA
jgi:hypothetical protein